jgi:redox-sensitive bicupin YhaK (pirin superfamily)
MVASPELTRAHEAEVGDIMVRRLLPQWRRRTVGAWCFVDHYGPMSVDGVAGMQVPPHPHIGRPEPIPALPLDPRRLVRRQ